ncbi:MAG TPA: hypothetical protein DEA32_02370 [Firmicutes bacterium]|nr:hypothetical protein [Bacillota bacterium]
MSYSPVFSEMLKRLKDSESWCFGGSAAFLFAGLHAAEIFDSLKGTAEGIEDEIEDIVASSIHGFDMDEEVFSKADPTLDELTTWSDQYSYFATRIIGLGQDTEDHTSMISVICLTEVLDSLELKQQKFLGHPTDGSIHTALMDITDRERQLAKELIGLPHDQIKKLEMDTALSLFHKLLTRRQKFKAAPVDISDTLSKIEELISADTPDRSLVVTLAGRAGICFKATRCSVKIDYAFVDRVLTFVSKTLA